MKRATRGNMAEAKVLAALIEREFDVLVPFGDGHFRIEPTLNNQAKGVRFARDFEIQRWTSESLAAVA